MKKFAVAGAAVLLALVAIVVAFHFRPLETFVAFERLELRSAGVRRVRSAGLGAYERDGCRSGRPCRCVALIHGLGDSSITWHEILRGPIPPDTKLIALDLPGTEDSAPPADASGYAIAPQAKAVRAALEPVCPRWTVAGNSLGGWIAARLALDWPAGVERLVLLDAAGLDDDTGTIVRAGVALAYPSVPQMKEFSRLAFDHPQDIPERAWRSSVELLRQRPAKATFLALSRADLLDRKIGKLRVPTRILWGASDGVVPLDVGRRYHRLIAGSTLEVIDHCGHLPQQECPEPVQRAIFGP